MQTTMELFFLVISAILINKFIWHIPITKYQQVYSKERSTKWKRLREKYLAANPSCALCGKSTDLIVHHKLPFCKFPHKELDWDNLITLCESKNLNCHFVIGHLMNWQDFNPNIDKDIEFFKQKLGIDKKSSSHFLWW